MRTGFSRSTAARLAENGAFLVIALALSYIEAIVPLSAAVPIPGAKPGLANLALLCVAYRRGIADAAVISLSRVLISAFLFGSISSLAFSLSGALCALAVLALMRPLWGRAWSAVGISVACAAAHNSGQLFCAMFWMHESALLSYLPALWVMAAVFGTVVGAAANILCARLPAAGGSI